MKGRWREAIIFLGSWRKIDYSTTPSGTWVCLWTWLLEIIKINKWTYFLLWWWKCRGKVMTGVVVCEPPIIPYGNLLHLWKMNICTNGTNWIMQRVCHCLFKLFAKPTAILLSLSGLSCNTHETLFIYPCPVVIHSVFVIYPFNAYTSARFVLYWFIRSIDSYQVKEYQFLCFTDLGLNLNRWGCSFRILVVLSYSRPILKSFKHTLQVAM